MTSKAANPIARVAVLGVVSLAAGCTHTPPAPVVPAPPADVSRLAPPGALTPRSASQVIHAAYGARDVTLRTAIQIDAAGLVVVGVSATGQRLFTASWDGKNVKADRSAFVPKDLAPERVLADMQLALWPLESVRASLRGSGQEVTEPFPGVRRLRRGDRMIAETHYAGPDPWNGRLWFVNFEFGYSLTIDTTTAAN
jgi:hypothetical protein